MRMEVNKVFRGKSEVIIGMEVNKMFRGKNWYEDGSE
jgi:hypothetical protein